MTVRDDQIATPELVTTGTGNNHVYEILKEKAGLTRDTVFKRTGMNGSVVFHGHRGAIFFAARELMSVPARELKMKLIEISSEEIVDGLLDRTGEFIWPDLLQSEIPSEPPGRTMVTAQTDLNRAKLGFINGLADGTLIQIDKPRKSFWKKFTRFFSRIHITFGDRTEC